ncbi:MAG: alkaline phosphatase family protein [Prevotella sp.]|nr:alkaline phosphatase family protein [Prevotella sp.]
MNKYLALIIAVITGTEMQAIQLAPRLVVNITIDQLRTDYLEAFTPLYKADGFRKLMKDGMVYDVAAYPFSPVDNASAVSTVVTGTTPYYHGIIANRWLDRKTLRPIFCVDDPMHFASPHRLMTSTIGDELKVSTQGSAIVWSVAASKESAILSAGHAANGVLWIDASNTHWRTSTYYSATAPEWFKSNTNVTRDIVKNKQLTNEEVVDMSLKVVKGSAMGADEISDMLMVTLSAANPDGIATDWQTEMESVYMQLDNSISRLITGIERAVGNNRVLFVVTSTGHADERESDLSQYRIPTGTFYINRTANLLNMFLSAVYGQGRYVEMCFSNQMYLNHKLIEEKRINMSELLQRAQDFLVQNAGIADVYTSERLLAGNNDILKLRNGFNPSLSGDIIIEVAPGWRLQNEDTNESFTSRSGYIPFPIIFFGAGTPSGHVQTPVTVDRIAPTIAKSIRIRAPNACSTEPLF